MESNLKPDSEKSTLEKAQESIKGTGDSIAGTVQPGKSSMELLNLESKLNDV